MTSESSASESRPPRVTWETVWRSPDRDNDWKRIPRLIWEALRLGWGVNPGLALFLSALQLVTGAAIGIQLLVGRHVLQKLLALGDSGGSIASLLPSLTLFVVIMVALGILGATVANRQAMLSELVGMHTYDQIMQVAASVEIFLYEDPRFLDELIRARTTGMLRAMEIMNGISSLALAVFASVGIGFALATMHLLLLPLVVMAGVPLLVATLTNSRQVYRFEYHWTPQNRERGYLMELLTAPSSAKEIRIFDAHRFLKQRYDALNQERLRLFRDYLGRRFRVAVSGQLGASIGAALALGVLIWLAFTGRIDLATAMTAGAAMQLLSGRLSNISRGVGRLVESGMFFQDYQSFLGYVNASRSTQSRSTGTTAGAFERLEVENVSFNYPGTTNRVLEQLSLVVDKGEVVALVGENGSGKTTLVKLILQLYHPNEGRILWNGMDTDQLEQNSLRSEMTVIFQDFIQYHLSVADNILLGRAGTPPSAEAVEDAARRVGADAFLQALPMGYETRLGREFLGGHELSIGQWQRLALARAVFRGGSLLILDEPTASLDPRAEHELFAQIRKFTRERSVLLISHRFSSVRTADRIYVLKDGRITEHGSHDDLMRRNGHYAELFRLQAAAYLPQDGVDA